MRTHRIAALVAPLVIAAFPTPLASQPSEVMLHDFEFRPAVTRLTVSDYGPGVEVRWMNQGPSTHTVTADGGAFDSKALAPGAAFSFRFEAPGTVDYRCTIHQGMRGQIVVTASGY